jgi:hypothetical protein
MHRNSAYLFLLAIAGLITVGIIMLYSTGAFAHDAHGDPYYFLKRQGVALAVGAVGCLIAARIKYQFWQRTWWIWYAISMVLLVLCFVPGVGKRTAERLIVELREKVAGELTEGIPAAGNSEEAEPRLLARDGLMHLGYTITEAESLLEGTEGSSAEELINAALRKAAEGTRART